VLSEPVDNFSHKEIPRSDLPLYLDGVVYPLFEKELRGGSHV
jgi:hypothetical protein